MPFYDYICKECKKVFEVQKGMNEKAEPKCPHCKSSNTARKFNRVGKMASKGEDFGHSSHEQGGSCGSCSSGVCSSCSH